MATYLARQSRLDTAFGGSDTWFVQVTAGISGWLSWTLALLAEWWLERSPVGAHRSPAEGPREPDLGW